ncbi:hypothetical protein HUN36_22185 [Acinetobacter bereziniae]|nr:hypothetical protein [Acinetobacter bereziniae]
MSKEAIAAFKENIGITQYCSMIFKFSTAKNGSSEDLKINYEYITSRSGHSKKFFKTVADIRRRSLKELTFIKSDNLIKIKFADDQSYEYEVIGGDVDKLFNLDRK